MASRYPHLLPNTSIVADASNDIRLSYIESDRWINYAGAKATLDKLEDLLAQPRKERMRGMLIVGRSNNGKSTLIDRFVKRHPAVDNPGGKNIIANVLRVTCPPGPSEGGFYDAIFRTLSKRTVSYRNAGEKLEGLVDLLKIVETKMLIVDEINHLLASTLGTQRAVLNALKYLSSMCELCVVATGTPEAERAVQSDAQIASRLIPCQLPLWIEGSEYRALLSSLEQLLPLKEPSCLSVSPLPVTIHGRTDGTIGSTAELLNSAAKWAIKNGREKIDIHALQMCDYKSPAQMLAERKPT